MLNIFMELDRKSYKPLYIQLSEIIIDYANENDFKNGDILPSENELLSRFDVSRHTIRLAVERLVQLGAAQKMRGQGTFFIEKEKTQSIHFHFNFNKSAEKIGLEVTNKLIDKKTVRGRVNWFKGLTPDHWDETVSIRRMKSTSGELLAIDERILPGFVVKRYSQEEIKNENLFFDLMEKNSDTQTEQFNYTFISQALTNEESELLKFPRGTSFLRRIGEYYNVMNELFMLSRLTIVSDRINLKYAYTKQKNGWIIQG